MARLLSALLCLPLVACQPAALALLGAGATSAVRYNIDGVAARTFTAPADKVKSASLAALERMGIQLNSWSATETTELIYARAARRDIEIELEPISARATRLRVIARDESSIFYDTATALEIVQQTEKLLAAAPIADSATGGAQAAKLAEN
jgi:Protein of unknown function (DUF3568)